MVLLQASGSHHICIKYISASLREDGISRTICGLPMASPLSLSEVCSKFLGIKTFHLVGRLVQMQGVKEEVKQQYSLRGGETVYPAEKLHNHRKHTTQKLQEIPETYQIHNSPSFHKQPELLWWGLADQRNCLEESKSAELSGKDT